MNLGSIQRPPASAIGGPFRSRVFSLLTLTPFACVRSPRGNLPHDTTVVAEVE